MTTTTLTSLAAALVLIAVLIGVHWCASRHHFRPVTVWLLRVVIGVLQMCVCQVLAGYSAADGNIGSACLWGMGAIASLVVNLPFPENSHHEG